MPEFTGHRDMMSYVRTIWRWKLLILVLVVGAPVVSYLVERNKQPTYQASALISINNATSSSSASANAASSPFATGNINAIARLLTTTPIADIAGRQMSPPVSGLAIVNDVTATADPTTGFISITANAANPYFASKVANAFAQALSIRAHAYAVNSIDSQIAQIRSQISKLGNNNVNSLPLKAQLSGLESELGAPSGTVSVLQAATPDTTPTGPHKKRAVELGLVVGILLAIAAVMLLDSADRRLRSPDDLEALTKLPLLGAIAPSAFGVGLETTPVDEESFQTLRTSLTYFNVEQKVRSVLVTSPGEQEGKSTVTVRLALASARAGLDVVLVDADLRRAGATAKLGLRPTVGLGLVLAEQRPVVSALQEWPLGPDETGRLRILPAGDPPPNPAALLGSDSMRNLLSTLEAEADLVLVDTPAALAVSDSIPLVQSVSGVVLIARMNRSKRDTVHRLQKIIDSAHGRLLGTVATGVTSGPGYEKYSQAYYAPLDKASGKQRSRRGAAGAGRGVPLGQPQSAPTDKAAEEQPTPVSE